MCRIVLRLLLCLQTLISGQLVCAGDTWLRKLGNQRTQASWCSRKWDRNKTAEGRVTTDQSRFIPIETRVVAYQIGGTPFVFGHFVRSRWNPASGKLMHCIRRDDGLTPQTYGNAKKDASGDAGNSDQRSWRERSLDSATQTATLRDGVKGGEESTSDVPRRGSEGESGNPEGTQDGVALHSARRHSCIRRNRYGALTLEHILQLPPNLLFSLFRGHDALVGACLLAVFEHGPRGEMIRSGFEDGLEPFLYLGIFCEISERNAFRILHDFRE